ncbi:efflux RND transporter periplasmic adaptor subunit [uncultured Sunxiuqinia sp.]|uniref:efflux RND transporter periplasmic adaptor subunit n=1 Tax=Sunxiuqinia rutila TaxID=1397841 RepID=UPI0026323D83|nr:efflux RND transporter periplasmic adaptor subunit [uncultured Sunxiuqinia sp.]
MNRLVRNIKLIPQLAALLAVIVLASCSAGNAEDTQAKQAQLVEYKQQMHELELKIAELEKELKDSLEVEKIQVVLSELQPQMFEHFIEVSGSVEADQEVNVSPEGSGQILEIQVQEGDRVSKGTVLATLNSEPIERTIDEVEINLELARTTFERQKNLWDQNIGSELQFLQAKSAKDALEKQLQGLKAQKSMSTITAPVDGVIDVIYQKQGQIASPQVPFAKLVNIQKIKVYADVAESYLTKISEGDDVQVYFPAIGQSRKTKVQMIGNYIDPNNRTFRVRIDLQNKDNLIKPNLDAVVTLRDYVAEEAIVIPSLLIKEDFKGNYTFVARNEEDQLVARKVYIEPGMSDNNMSEVLGGLNAGEHVIAEGFSQVVDGTVLHAN